jgi:hypothetical protein
MARLVEQGPMKKLWAAFEMPVLVDLESGRIHSLEKTPIWGAFYFRGFRQLVRETLG